MLNVYCLNRVKSTRDIRDMVMVVPCLILIRTLGSSLHSTVSLSFLCLKELFKAIVKSLKKNQQTKAVPRDAESDLGSADTEQVGFLGVSLHARFLKAFTSMSGFPS